MCGHTKYMLHKWAQNQEETARSMRGNVQEQYKDNPTPVQWRRDISQIRKTIWSEKLVYLYIFKSNKLKDQKFTPFNCYILNNGIPK